MRTVFVLSAATDGAIACFSLEQSRSAMFTGYFLGGFLGGIMLLLWLGRPPLAEIGGNHESEGPPHPRSY